MATVIKCDITGAVEVPMFRVGDHTVIPPEFEGERLKYSILVDNKNGNAISDVSQEYVLAELISILNKRLNEVRNPPKEQTDKTGVTEL